MGSGQRVIYEEEAHQLQEVIEQLVRDALAKAIFIVDPDGQLIAATGETGGIDTTGLASLVAGATAATGGLAAMVGEEEFPVHFHEGRDIHLHISLIRSQLILVVIFDERSNQGLVRLRVKRTYPQLETVLEAIQKRQHSGQPVDDIFGGISDDDIDSLFNDTF